MTIIEALVQLRNDLKLWCINNFNHKLNKNLGTEESGKFLTIDSAGDVVTAEISGVNYISNLIADAQQQIDTKAEASDLSNYYTKTEIDSMEFITTTDIDTICGATIT